MHICGQNVNKVHALVQLLTCKEFNLKGNLLQISHIVNGEWNATAVCATSQPASVNLMFVDPCIIA